MPSIRKIIFNRTCVKISYKTSPNLAQIIARHNAKILKGGLTIPDRDCNCKKNTPCPLQGKCLNKNIIYQATIQETISKKEETYIGLTSTSFKERLANHQQTFKNKNLQKSCKLAQHIWTLKEKNIKYNIEWKLISRAKPFSQTSKICNLCVLEKYFILCKPKMGTINKRTELTNSCRHKSKLLIDKG